MISNNCTQFSVDEGILPSTETLLQSFLKEFTLRNRLKGPAAVVLIVKCHTIQQGTPATFSLNVLIDILYIPDFEWFVETILWNTYFTRGLFREVTFL